MDRLQCSHNNCRMSKFIRHDRYLFKFMLSFNTLCVYNLLSICLLKKGSDVMIQTTALRSDLIMSGS